METGEHLNIYEYLDQSGVPSQFICDGHVDSVLFRDKCYEDYYVRPMVVRHQWQKTRRIASQRPGKKFKSSVLETVYLSNQERGSVPVTIGLL